MNKFVVLCAIRAISGAWSGSWKIYCAHGFGPFLNNFFLNNNLRYKRCLHDWLWTRWLNPWSYARPRGSPGNRSCKKRCLNLESLILRQIWSYQVQGSRQKVRKYFIATVRTGKHWQNNLLGRNEPLSHALRVSSQPLIGQLGYFLSTVKESITFYWMTVCLARKSLHDEYGSLTTHYYSYTF